MSIIVGVFDGNTFASVLRIAVLLNVRAIQKLFDALAYPSGFRRHATVYVGSCSQRLLVCVLQTGMIWRSRICRPVQLSVAISVEENMGHLCQEGLVFSRLPVANLHSTHARGSDIGFSKESETMVERVASR